MRICDDCKFVDRVTEKSSHSINLTTMKLRCWRFPKHENVRVNHYCGEFVQHEDVKDCKPDEDL